MDCKTQKEEQKSPKCHKEHKRSTNPSIISPHLYRKRTLYIFFFPLKLLFQLSLSSEATWKKSSITKALFMLRQSAAYYKQRRTWISHRWIKAFRKLFRQTWVFVLTSWENHLYPLPQSWMFHYISLCYSLLCTKL